MKKKSMAILLACTMLISMAICIPASAADAYDEWGTNVAVHPASEWYGKVSDAKNTNYTMTLGTNATAEVCTTEIKGKTDTVKIVHTENTQTKIDITEYLTADKTGVIGAYYWSFYIADSDAANPMKVKLEGGRGGDIDSKFFTNALTVGEGEAAVTTPYTFFRKMTTANIFQCYGSDLHVTIEGQGTLYLGEIEVETSKIINGGFEGTVANGVPAGYVASGLSAGYYTLGKATGLKNFVWTQETQDIPASAADGIYFCETPDGNYIAIKNQHVTGGDNIKYQLNTFTRNNDLTTGLYYIANGSADNEVFDFRFKSKSTAGNEVGISLRSDQFNISNYTYGNMTTPRTEWTEQAVSVSKKFGGDGRYWVEIHSHNGGSGAKITKFDDFRITKNTEEVSLQTSSDGTTWTNNGVLVNGQKVKVSLLKQLFANEAAVDNTMSNEKVCVIAALYNVEDSFVTMEEVKVASALQGTFAGNVWNAKKVDYAGYALINPSFEFDVPAEGNYAVKLFIWDGENKIMPVGGEYTFTTPALG